MTLIAAALTLGGCTVPVADPLPPVEAAARAALAETPIRVVGVVVESDGTPVQGAQVRVGAQVTTTDRDGLFTLSDLPRANDMLVVDATGYHVERLPLALLQPVAVEQLTVQAIFLREVLPDVPRLVFGGDVSFGRRFLDPDSSTPLTAVPPDDPRARIQSSDPFTGSYAAIAPLEDWFADADWVAVNLESPVTDAPQTPHPTKDYVFFTLPESVDALTAVGVDFASIGNNHVFDYLEAGLIDTLGHLEAAGLPHAGAGLDPASAWAVHDTDIGALAVTIMAATTISGEQHEIHYVADDNQGGAADLYDSERLTASIVNARLAGRVPIAFLHLGDEYVQDVSETAAGRFEKVAEAGAALIVAAHPHVPQGFKRYSGVLAVHSMGNLVFDQDRLETLVANLIRVDLSAVGVENAVAVPIVLENYSPRPLVNRDLANNVVRRSAETSVDVVVVPWNGTALLMDAMDVSTADRLAEFDVDIPYTRKAILDLRDQMLPGESIASVTLSRPGLLQVGRDILEHGGFEDEDVDSDDGLQLARWDLGSSSFACVHGPRRGAVALCLDRGVESQGDAAVSFRNRIRVWGDAEDAPVYDQTAVGYIRADGAGPITIELTWTTSLVGEEFETVEIANHPGATTDWTRFTSDIALPDEPEARAMRLVIKEGPTTKGTGLAIIDDLAIVAWNPFVDAAEPLELSTPHAMDFVQAEADPGPLRISVILRSTKPIAAP